MNFIGLILFAVFVLLLLVTIVAAVLAVRSDGGSTPENPQDAPPEFPDTDTAHERIEQEAAIDRGREALNSLLQNVSRSVASYMGDVGAYDSSLASHRASLEGIQDPAEAEDVGRRILAEVERMHQTNAQYRDQLEKANQVIEEQRNELRKLSLFATTDFLTRIPNRRTLDSRLQEAFAAFKRGGPAFSFALIDVDHFKRVNDDHGHLVGDELLMQITQSLLAAKREADFLARYGGEEFALLLPATQVDEARQIADRLRQEVATHALKAGDKALHTSVSAGVTEVLSSDPNLQACVQRADEALYRAKEGGRNQVTSAH